MPTIQKFDDEITEILTESTENLVLSIKEKKYGVGADLIARSLHDEYKQMKSGKGRPSYKIINAVVGLRKAIANDDNLNEQVLRIETVKTMGRNLK